MKRLESVAAAAEKWMALWTIEVAIPSPAFPNLEAFRPL